MVNTKLGAGLGLPAKLAPTSTKWHRVFVVNENTVVIAGATTDEAIAIRSTNKGKSWVSLRAKASPWNRWGAGADGSVVLAAGDYPSAKSRRGPIGKTRLYFAGPTDNGLSAPAPLFPAKKTGKNARINQKDSSPAVWSDQLAALIVDLGPGKRMVGYGVPTGRDVPPLGSIGRLRQFVTTPFGRPPSLVSLEAGALNVRPWPKPGQKLFPPTPIPGLRAHGALLQQLQKGPACEARQWSFKCVSPTPSRPYLVGVSPGRSFAFPLPQGTTCGQLGCSDDAVVVRSVDKKSGQPRFIRCRLNGKCTTPKSKPFEIWKKPHDRSLKVVATKKGTVATMSAVAKEGHHWGLYLAQSLDAGEHFEVPRVIGEGKTERGRFEIGALVAVGNRVLLLISADVTGTSRRGWYVLASDDDGTNWGPP